MRFRAVIMTSIAFILGLVPLVWAHGAAMMSRRAVGTAVFAGMIFRDLDRRFPDPHALCDVPGGAGAQQSGVRAPQEAGARDDPRRIGSFTRAGPIGY